LTLSIRVIDLTAQLPEYR